MKRLIIAAVGLALVVGIVIAGMVGNPFGKSASASAQDGTHSHPPTLTEACLQELDVVLIIDRSGSMGPPTGPQSGGHYRIYWAQQAANDLVDALASGDDDLSPHRVSVVSFDGGNTGLPILHIALDAGTSATAVHNAINGITTGGSTYIAPGLQYATTELTDHYRSAAYRVAILLSDGQNYTNPGESPDTATRRSDTEAAIPGLDAVTNTVYAIGIGDESVTSPPYAVLDVDLLKNHIADGPPGRYINVVDASDLPGIFDDMLGEICGAYRPPKPSQVDRDIVIVQGIDSQGYCDGAALWVESYLESSAGKSFFGATKIGKYLQFNYAGGGFTCSGPGSTPAYSKSDTCAGIPDAADKLKQLIDGQTTAKTTIVAHSMGGLVSAYLVAQNPQWARSHIASVVTLDSPLRGLSATALDALTAPSVCPRETGSIPDMAEDSSVVHAVSGAANVVPFYALDATQLDFPPANIEYVPRDRASLDGARPLHFVNSCNQPGANPNTCEPPRGVDDDHSSIWGRQLDEHGENDKGFLVGCAETLALDCTFLTAPTTQGLTTETYMAIGPTAKQVRFISNFGSIVQMTLVSPDGTIYGPDGAGPVLAYGVDDVSETYVIENPPAGDWTIRLYGIQVPPEGEQVPLAVLEEEANAPLAVGGIAELPALAGTGGSGMGGTTYAVLAGAAAGVLAFAVLAALSVRRWRVR